MNIFLKIALHFICRKNSRRPNFSACVSILGITFGVISFLTVVTILDAFQLQMQQMISSMNPNLTVFSPMGMADFKKIEKKIISLEPQNIEKISPFIYQESILANKKYTSSVYIRAIPGMQSSSSANLEKFIKPKDALSTLSAQTGQLSSPTQNSQKASAPFKVILGKELAHILNVDVNSVLTLMTFEPQENRAPRIRYTKIEVIGLISVGLAQYDKQYMLMNFDDAQKLFGAPNWASGFEIKLKNPNDALEISSELSQKLPYSTIAWQEIDANLFHQINRDSSVIKFIVFIISVVGTFNILITLGLTVIDRTKQIALMRCLGAQKKHIISIFIGIGAILGFIGACLGTIVSLILLVILSKVPLGDLNQFYYLEKIPVNFNLPLIFVVFVSVIALAMLGALYPAQRAAKISPITGLK